MVQGLSSVMRDEWDVTDPRVEMMIGEMAKNPNRLAEIGKDVPWLYAKLNDIQRLRQQRVVPPNTNVLQDLAAQAATQGGIADQPISPDMYETFTAAGGGIVAFAGDGPSLVREDSPIEPEGLGGFLQRMAPSLYMREKTPGELPQRGIYTRDPLAQFSDTLRVKEKPPGGLGISATSSYGDFYGPGIPAVATATQPSPGGIVPPRVARRPAAPVVSTPMTSSGEPSGVGYETLSPGDLAMAAANRKREAYVESMRPKTRKEYTDEIRKEYEEEGIGKAAQERSKQLAEREGRMKEGQDRRFWLDAAASFFDMAAEAAKSGQAGGALQSLLRSASKGGQSFAERTRITRDKYETAQQQLEEAKANLAEKNEQVRMGIIDKGSANLKNAESLYQKAQDDVIEADRRAAELMKTQEFLRNKMVFEQHAEDKRLSKQLEAQRGLAKLRLEDSAQEKLRVEYLDALTKAKTPAETQAVHNKYRPMFTTLSAKENPLEVLSRLGPAGGGQGQTDPWANARVTSAVPKQPNT